MCIHISAEFYHLEYTWKWYLLRIIEAGLTELSVILPPTPAEFVLQLHLRVGDKLVWTF